MLPLSTLAIYGNLIVFLCCSEPVISVLYSSGAHVFTTNLSMGFGGQEGTQLHPIPSISRNAPTSRVSIPNVGGSFRSVNLQTVNGGINRVIPSHVIKATNSDDLNPSDALPSRIHDLAQELGKLLLGHTKIKMGQKIWNLDTKAAARNYECLAFAAEKLEKQLIGNEGKERKEMVLEGAKLALAKYEINRLLWRKIQMTKILEGMTPQEALLKVKFNLTNVQNWVLDLVHVNKTTMDKTAAMEHNVDLIRTLIHSIDGTLVKEFEENEQQSFKKSQDEAEEVLALVEKIVPMCNFDLDWDKKEQTLNGSGN